MMLSQKSKLIEDRDKTLSSILYIRYKIWQKNNFCMVQEYFLSKNTLKYNSYYQQYIIHKYQLYHQNFQEYHEYDMPLLEFLE